ncbi:MAG: hypothetical protein QOJ20_1235 [Mycobacterium sp.]|nr:hypothetical protein [Mycobacterium sp.]
MRTQSPTMVPRISSARPSRRGGFRRAGDTSRRRAASPRHAADDTCGHHPVGHRRRTGQRVRATTREADDLHPVDPEGVGDGAQVVGEREHGVVLIGRRRPDAGPVDTDQPDLPLLGVYAGLHWDLPAGARRAVQPKHGAALRIAELGKPDLTVIADSDVAFQPSDGQLRQPCAKCRIRPNGTGTTPRS